jgi:hypothetical protein
MNANGYTGQPCRQSTIKHGIKTVRMDNINAFFPEEPGKPEDATEVPAQFALQHHDAAATRFNVISKYTALIQTTDKRGDIRHSRRLNQITDEHLQTTRLQAEHNMRNFERDHEATSFLCNQY